MTQASTPPPAGPPALSFVIPAKNEAAHIDRTLQDIHRFVTAPFEVIVVDNESTDATAAIAAAQGAVVEMQPGSIGALRNAGAARARGDLLVFLDADVSLTAAWRDNIDHALAPIRAGERLVTGSHCLPTDDSNPLERYWFAALATDPRSTHVGSAHLILAREEFTRIGGFDTQLTTGEDYEFCSRAKALGCRVVNNPQLPVIHHGFPQRLGPFMRREAWHGLGDLQSWRMFATSRVVQATLLFVTLHALALMALLLGNGAVVTLCVGALATLLLAASFAKYRHAGGRATLINAGIFYFYFCGRAWGVLRFLRGERRTASPRSGSAST